MTTPDRTDEYGLRLVPIEPTPDMRIAGGTAWSEALKDAETYVDCADACYKAMIRTAPDTGEGISLLFRDVPPVTTCETCKGATHEGKPCPTCKHITAPPKPAPDVREGTPRCPVCDWPMAADQSIGCVPGDCSYRPDDPAEQRRIRERRANLAVQSGAAPSPVKPDRETLIHTICPHIRQYSDSHWQGNHACLQCPATVKTPQGDAVQRCRRDAEGAADDVIRCWQSTGDQQAPQVSGASTPSVASHDGDTR